MGKRLLLLFTIYCLLLPAIFFTTWQAGITPSFAEPVASDKLIENAKAYNNQCVEYNGEAVGDVMNRGDFAWVNLHDGKNAIGVWMKKEYAALIKYKGDYKFKGDTVSAKGIFHRACPQHGGDLDIHADEVVKVSDGCPTPHPIKKFDLMNTIGLLIVAAGIFLLAEFKMKKR
jgi:hypothetical protein